MEARNQARVHLWFKPRFGADYPPLQSADESLTRYASIVHAFGVRLEADGELDVIAPFGLDGMVIRPNRMINNQVSHEAKASRAKDTGEISQFPYKGLLHVHGGFDSARLVVRKPFTRGEFCFPAKGTASAPRNSTRFAAQYPAHGRRVGRGGWLGLTPWTTCASCPLRALLELPKPSARCQFLT